MLLVKNIKSLCGITDGRVRKVSGAQMKTFQGIDNAYLIIDGGVIKGFGAMNDFKENENSFSTVIDATGRYVMPCWCDSHTHTVFASWRETEFTDRIKGLSYQEIASRGGGILNSATKMAAATEEELFNDAYHRIAGMIKKGTGAIEIKSGYGLSVEAELKMLRVIKKLKQALPIPVKATFLGAHAIPENYKQNHNGYIELLINELIPVIEKENLADYCDVFCEHGYFTKEETITILEAGKKHGMKPKVHAHQLSNSGGVQAGVKCNAISVDHLEYVGDEEVNLLLSSQTMPVVLPGAAFFLNLPLPPARKMIDAGLPLAVATDFNPGSSPSGDMNFMIAMLCIQYKLLPEEAFNAATINAAYAMDLAHSHGSIAVGKQANFFITQKISSLTMIPYAFNDTVIEKVFINGKLYK